MAIKILAIPGSARRDSFNRKLIEVAVKSARAAGAEVTCLEPRDHELPIYDGDLETEYGLPEPAMKLKEIFKAHQGLLISSPEYNSSISPYLKNLIDWVSRPVPNEPPLGAFKGKTAGLLAASPGALGGLRGLVTVRYILGNIGVIVLPEQVAIQKANEAFKPDGSLVDAKQEQSVANFTQRLVQITTNLS